MQTVRSCGVHTTQDPEPALYKAFSHSGKASSGTIFASEYNCSAALLETERPMSDSILKLLEKNLPRILKIVLQLASPA